ncbi:MAG: HAD hydrolase family protein [Pseudomonadota bacterium]
MQAHPPVLVFSDLDGTLLDHSTYSWKPAKPALSYLRRLGCGVVLATSKTAAEVAPLRDEIGFSDWPSIVENGGGLLLANKAAESTGPIYQELRMRLAELPPGFVGFGDMSISEICERTGLSEDAARNAKMRRFSEPGVWTASESALDAFISAANLDGLLIQRGGRFLSISFGGTKADRMSEVIRQISPKFTIALGDAPNDIDMLERADHGVIVANSASTLMPRLHGEATGRIRRTTQEGPSGWSKAVLEILEETSMASDIPKHG